MEKVYACLAGEWVCLNDDPKCHMTRQQLTPSDWLELDGPIYNQKDFEEDSWTHMPYIHIFYKGKHYRMNPIFIQTVEEFN